MKYSTESEHISYRNTKNTIVARANLEFLNHTPSLVTYNTTFYQLSE